MNSQPHSIRATGRGEIAAASEKSSGARRRRLAGRARRNRLSGRLADAVFSRLSTSRTGASAAPSSPAATSARQRLRGNRRPPARRKRPARGARRARLLRGLQSRHPLRLRLRTRAHALALVVGLMFATTLWLLYVHAFVSVHSAPTAFSPRGLLSSQALFCSAIKSRGSRRINPVPGRSDFIEFSLPFYEPRKKVFDLRSRASGPEFLSGRI